MVTFGKPSWNSKANMYVIQILEAEDVIYKGEPQYIDVSSNDVSIEPPDTNSDSFKDIISKFIAKLIQKDKEVKWFATPLRESSVLRRLEHRWTSSASPPTGWCSAIWIPITLEITKTSFIISWSTIQFEDSSPRIPSRFLSLSEPNTPRASTPDSTQETNDLSTAIRQFTYQPQESSEMEQVYDIPLSTDSNEIDLEEQRKERQSIREARLRVELAQMKLEKHLQNYYRKYGSIPDESDSESETTSFEEVDE
jgi:hypothetical protein